MSFNIAFKRNIEGLQRVIQFLGNDVDNSENKELLGNALKEYRLWVRLYLDSKDKLNMQPIETKDEIYFKVIECMKRAKIPLKYIVRFEKELKKYGWKHIEKGVG